MNSNINEIVEFALSLDKTDDVLKFFNELFTESELSILSKRWQILKMLSQEKTQREISKELNVSLCNVTRGAKILKDKNSVITKLIKQAKKH